MEKEKIIVHLSKSMLTLSFQMFEGDIDVDDLTKIHYHNLFGELVTISALLNKVGLILAEAEEAYNLKKLEREICEAELQKRIRRESISSGGKFKTMEYNKDGSGILGTEIYIKTSDKSIEQAIILDPGYQISKKNEIKAYRDYMYVDKLYWAVSSKDKKLNNLMREIKPEDFEKEIVEGVINGMMVKKTLYKNIV
jgi:hypothetical protein